MVRILVVNKSEVARAEISTNLRDRAHDVIELHDAHEAIDLLANGETFDLLVCDYHLPSMDALTMLAELRKDGAAVPPACLISSSVPAELKQVGKSLGVVLWVVRPFHQARFMEAIQRLVEPS